VPGCEWKLHLLLLCLHTHVMGWPLPFKENHNFDVPLILVPWTRRQYMLSTWTFVR
jgi:hypothetical protein